MSGLANPKLIRYENAYCRYVRKPHDLPSVRGDRVSIFDIITYQCKEGVIDMGLHQLVTKAQQCFGVDSERGLLNRLDVPTGGLLYFAKTKNIWKQYRASTPYKYYMATIVGKLDTTRIVGYYIGHHPHLADRMVCASRPGIVAHRGQRQSGVTTIQPLDYDTFHNHTHVHITISGGIRHQIRVHCAAVGSPIVGETLYGTKANRQHDPHLHLRSVGHYMADMPI